MAAITERKMRLPEKEFIDLIRYQVDKNKRIDDNNWGAYGVSIEDYGNYFRAVLGQESIISIIEHKPCPVVIDLMGPSYILVTLFKKISCATKLGIAVSLCDRRSDSSKEEDENLGIKQIAGDILEASTWGEIEKELNGRKADLIMERAMAGFDEIPYNKKLYALLLNKVWKLLSNNNGVAIMQIACRADAVQDLTDISASDWIKLVREKGIDITSYGNSLKIVKTPNSPKDLPFLE